MGGGVFQDYDDRQVDGEGKRGGGGGALKLSRLIGVRRTIGPFRYILRKSIFPPEGKVVCVGDEMILKQEHINELIFVVFFCKGGFLEVIVFVVIERTLFRVMNYRWELLNL